MTQECLCEAAPLGEAPLSDAPHGGVVSGASAECVPTDAPTLSSSDAEATAATLKALADPLRLRMLSVIAADPRGETCVCDLQQLGSVAQPTISHHLRVLRTAGLLVSERRGTWVWYRIVPERRAWVAALLAALTHQFEPVMAERAVDA